MDTWEAEKTAKELIKKYLGDTFQFKWNRSKTAYAMCDDDKRVIYLSRPLTGGETKEHVVDSILHEIAHALQPRNDRIHHSETWKNLAKALGAIPTGSKYSSSTHKNWKRDSMKRT